MFRPQLRLGLHGIVVVAALMLGGVDGFAQRQDIDSANYLLPGCRDLMNQTKVISWDKPFCSGMVHGLMVAPNCRPIGVTEKQVHHVILKYIDDRPARMHEDFRTLALEAMASAWPCKP
jgi:hypothetical protein